jgi:hypothetical protein
MARSAASTRCPRIPACTRSRLLAFGIRRAWDAALWSVPCSRQGKLTLVLAPAPHFPGAGVFGIETGADGAPCILADTHCASVSRPWGAPGCGTPAHRKIGQLSRTGPFRWCWQIHRFLFMASAVLFAASFTAAFASPVAF